jgi:hypothetical protein
MPNKVDDNRVSRRNREPFEAQPRHNTGDLWPLALRASCHRSASRRFRRGLHQSFQVVIGALPGPAKS